MRFRPSLSTRMVRWLPVVAGIPKHMADLTIQSACGMPHQRNPSAPSQGIAFMLQAWRSARTEARLPARVARASSRYGEIARDYRIRLSPSIRAELIAWFSVRTEARSLAPAAISPSGCGMRRPWNLSKPLPGTRIGSPALRLVPTEAHWRARVVTRLSDCGMH